MGEPAFACFRQFRQFDTHPPTYTNCWGFLSVPSTISCLRFDLHHHFEPPLTAWSTWGREGGRTRSTRRGRRSWNPYRGRGRRRGRRRCLRRPVEIFARFSWLLYYGVATCLPPTRAGRRYPLLLPKARCHLKLPPGARCHLELLPEARCYLELAAIWTSLPNACYQLPRCFAFLDHETWSQGECWKPWIPGRVQALHRLQQGIRAASLLLAINTDYNTLDTAYGSCLAPCVEPQYSLIHCFLLPASTLFNK